MLLRFIRRRERMASINPLFANPPVLNRATEAIEAQAIEAPNHRKMMKRATEAIVDCLQELTLGLPALHEEMTRKGR